MEVTFDLDANGILHVLVLEKTTATRERLVITNDKVALPTTPSRYWVPFVVLLCVLCSFCSFSLALWSSIYACEGEAQRGGD